MMEPNNSQSSNEDRGSDWYSDSMQLAEGLRESKKIYVTRESQEDLNEPSSSVGIHDLSELNKIQELDIVAKDGSVMGVRNRVRAESAHFENPEAVNKKSQEKGRVIVYLTSFRGVRRTFEECHYVKTVLYNFRVKVYEKDIYMNKHFYKELENRLEEDRSSKLSVPQVFIDGQHIGGKEEVEELNETGELRHLIKNFERQETSKKCGYCGGYNFIPCRKCGGSKDGIKNSFTEEFKALRCIHCNENGLEPCPGCDKPEGTAGSGGKSLWKKEELKKWKEREEYQRQEEQERRKEKKRGRIKREALENKFH